MTSKKNKIMVLITAVLLMLSPDNLRAEYLPEWLEPLRAAFYEQTLTPDQVMPLYNAAKSAAANNVFGNELTLALARCEYYMGRVLQDANRNDEARAHYNEGMRLAQRVLDISPGAEAWVLLAENLSQACSLGPWTYAAANGLNVEKYAKNALSFDPRNIAAQYLIAARWVYAPAPFSNHRRGIQMMEAILAEENADRNDRFNVYSAISYAYVQQKKYADARLWLLRALEIYPTNKHITELLNTR